MSGGTCQKLMDSHPPNCPLAGAKILSYLSQLQLSLLFTLNKLQWPEISSQSGYYNTDKVDLEQLSPGQPLRIQNESNGLWDLNGETIDIRPDKLSYLIVIEGRTFVRDRPRPYRLLRSAPDSDRMDQCSHII